MKTKEGINAVKEIFFYSKQFISLFVMNKYHCVVFIKKITVLPILKRIIYCSFCLFVKCLIQLCAFNSFLTFFNVILFVLYSCLVISFYIFIQIF